jgi:hypothetical protein
MAAARRAQAIFKSLGTIDELAGVKAARAALDSGSPIGISGRPGRKR